MKILSVTGHGCIRATKMNLCLMSQGHEVHLATKQSVPYGVNYKSHAIGENIDQMREAFKLYAPFVDLCHAHNEPSWYVSLWKEVSNKPIILDVHDSCLARVTPERWEKQQQEMGCHNVRVTAEERNNFQLADGLVFPGESFANLVRGEFGLTQPSIVLPSYVPQHFYSYQPLEWHGGLVYEGKVALEKELPMMEYCDYRAMAKQCNELGMNFHIYPAGYRADVKKFYGEDMEYVFIHEPMLLEQLTRQLGIHDWGLVGNLTSTSEWEYALPNKLFEYIAAGTPVVVMNSDISAKYVLEHGVGIVVKDLKELAERWGEHREIRKRLLANRTKHSMDSHIGELEDFYKVVLNNAN